MHDTCQLILKTRIVMQKLLKLHNSSHPYTVIHTIFHEWYWNFRHRFIVRVRLLRCGAQLLALRLISVVDQCAKPLKLWGFAQLFALE